MTRDEADRTVNVPAGEELSVTLPENPPTGYRWVVEAVNGDVRLASADVPATDVKPSAVGQRIIQPRAGARGQSELRLRHERAGASASADARRGVFLAIETLRSVSGARCWWIVSNEIDEPLLVFLARSSQAEWCGLQAGISQGIDETV
jgi:predicted secreted protein